MLQAMRAYSQSVGLDVSLGNYFYVQAQKLWTTAASILCHYNGILNGLPFRCEVAVSGRAELDASVRKSRISSS
jgi:hypothetical protein